MKKCNNCQTECKDDAIFCPECGERLEPEMGQEKTVDTQETVSEEIPEEPQKDMAEMNLAWKEKLDSITGLLKKNWKLVLAGNLHTGCHCGSICCDEKQKIYH